MMNNFEDKLTKNIFNYFIYFLIVLNVLPILAPIFSYLGLTFLSEPIYFLYSFTCHQFHWRSIHILDRQIAWCARDVFIWMSLLTTSLALKYKFLPSGLKWYWIIPFTVPIAIDGGFQTISTMLGFSSDFHIYLSTNLFRMITGSLFGMGLGLVIAPYLKAEQDLARGDHNEIHQPQPLKYFLKLTTIFLLLFALYAFLVQIWNLTSTEYKPVGSLDHATKPGPDIEDWTKSRRLHD